MKLSFCSLVLPPLLVWFSCHCVVAEYGKSNSIDQHAIQKPTPPSTHTRSGLKDYRETVGPTNSSRADFPCPASAAIAPCTCSVDTSRVTVDCTFVESVDQLVEVFQADFPVTELYQFTMSSNSALEFLPGFMNGITFESVYLGPGSFILLGIYEQFMFDLKDTLKEFVIYHTKLTTDFFPFYVLPSMNQLEDLRLYYCDINRFPQIRAEKLSRFALEHSPVELLANGTFSIGPGPMTIWINSNQIHTIEVGSIFFADQNSADSNELIEIQLQDNQLQSLKAGTFPMRNGPTTLILHSNQIASIEPGTFVLPASTGADSNELIRIDLFSNQLQSLKAGTFPMRNGPTTLYLYGNQIASIEPGTFVLPASTDLLTIILRLHDNELTTVDEAVFGALMPFISELRLNDNPLTCGCDMAWIITESTFMVTVDDDATCADGTNLHDLDPQQFIDFC